MSEQNTTMYRKLDTRKMVNTIEMLSRRINERFPNSHLSRVCSELSKLANESKDKSSKIARPNIALRVAIAVAVVLSVSFISYIVVLMNMSLQSLEMGELMQASEATLNIFILFGAAIFFLATVEMRIKRSKALRAIHELRSLAHVIDMHQLTKDPGRAQSNWLLTASSPNRSMTSFELTRYLDYCTEMLSLIGKVATLYAENIPDTVVLNAVNEVENLTTGLSQKIWQKIVILQRLDENNQEEDPINGSQAEATDDEGVEPEDLAQNQQI